MSTIKEDFQNPQNVLQQQQQQNNNVHNQNPFLVDPFNIQSVAVDPFANHFNNHNQIIPNRITISQNNLGLNRNSNNFHINGNNNNVPVSNRPSSIHQRTSKQASSDGRMSFDDFDFKPIDPNQTYHNTSIGNGGGTFGGNGGDNFDEIEENALEEEYLRNGGR